MIRYVFRPLWVVGIGWLVTLLVCPWLPVGWLRSLMVVCAAAFVLSLCIPACRHIHVIPLIAAACLLATGAYYLTYRQRVQPTEVSSEQALSLEVQVMENERYILLQVDRGDLPRGTQLIWYSPDPTLALEPYDRFTALFTIEPFSNDSTLSQLMRRAEGVWLRVNTVQTSAVEQTLMAGEAPWTASFLRVRNRLIAAIEQQLDGDIGAAVAGICYGAEEHLSNQAVSDFRNCGVSHLFSVSGLHMTVLLQGLIYLLRRLHIKGVWRSVIGALLLLGFMTIVGFSASVVRAGVVSLVTLFGSCLRRRADERNSLGLALLILLIPNPLAAYDAGLLLSFSATFGLLCWTDPIKRFLLRDREPRHGARIIKGVASTVAISLAALLATLPVLAIYFGRVSLMAVPVNLLTTLPAEVVLITGCVGSLLSVCGIAVIAQPLFLFAGLMSRYLLWVCEKFSSFSLATVAIRAPFLLLWLIGTYFLILMGRRVLDRQGLSLLSGVCICILCVGLLLHRGAVYNTLRAESAEDKNGQSVVVAYRGSTVLVTAPKSVTSLYEAKDALNALGSTRLDAVFVIGGEKSAVAYIPVVFKEHLTDSTQMLCSNLSEGSILLSQHRVRLGKSLEAQWQQEELLLNWGDLTLLFTAKSEAIGKADAVFTAGNISQALASI